MSLLPCCNFYQLSPALRNRFTEIWCPPTESREDLIKIIEHNLKPGIRLTQQDRRASGFGSSMLDFTDWLQKQEFGRRFVFGTVLWICSVA